MRVEADGMTAHSMIRIQNSDLRMSRLLGLMRMASEDGFEVWLDGDRGEVMARRRDG